MKIFLFCLLTLSVSVYGQTDSAEAKEIVAFQNELNAEYRDPKKSPLKGDDLKQFNGHDFFPIDLSYRVVAKLKRMPESAFMPMKTTSSQLKNHRIYAMVEFTLKGKFFSIPIYQSQNLLTTKEYADYLFFPFTDETTATESYGGGRYIDLRIPKSGDELVIDFNKAYNPYCAYSAGYSCPLVPSENHLDILIPAGVRFKGK